MNSTAGGRDSRLFCTRTSRSGWKRSSSTTRRTRGLRGYKRWRADIEELFERDRFQPEGLRAARDGRWVVLGRLQITQKDDAGDLDVPLAHVLEQRDQQGGELHGLLRHLGGARVGRAACLGQTRPISRQHLR